MKRKLMSVILGGIVLFAWGFISWVILPWHSAVANKLTSESAVAKVLKQNAPSPGIYYLPFAEEDFKPGETTAFLSILPNGYHGNMGQMMATGMVGQIISAFLMLLILQNTSLTSYWGKVRFITLVGLSIGFISHYTYWNWFEFATPYILLAILDSLIGWFLAGLVMAKFHNPENIESA
jgi:hypothetical protein